MLSCVAGTNNQHYESISENENYDHSFASEPMPTIIESEEYNSSAFYSEEDADIEKKIAEKLYEIKAVYDRYANFTSTWAKTDMHFFLTTNTNFNHPDDESQNALYRLSLSNISGSEIIAVPGDGEIEILGINEQYLFVSRRAASNDWFVRNFDIYRISLSSMEGLLIDSGAYYGVPRYHELSNSILFAHGNFDERIVQLESLQLDTGIRNTFFEFESVNFDSGMGWWPMEDDFLVFINSSWGSAEPESDFILINSELQAEQISFSQIERPYTQYTQPQNPAEEFIFDLDLGPFRNFVTIEDLVYYIWREDDWSEGWNNSMYGHLYSIKLDGTQNTLLQDDLDLSRLFSINNTLFATVLAYPLLGDDSQWHEAVKLSNGGGVLKVLGGGWHGHNAAFSIQQLAGSDMVMIMQLNFFRVDGWVTSLYCNTTGAFFSLQF